MRQTSLASELSESSPNKRSAWRHQCSGDPGRRRSRQLGFVRPGGGVVGVRMVAPVPPFKEQEVRFKQPGWLKSAGKPLLIRWRPCAYSRPFPPFSPDVEVRPLFGHSSWRMESRVLQGLDFPEWANYATCRHSTDGGQLTSYKKRHCGLTLLNRTRDCLERMYSRGER
jgi:hypothetical protein